MKALIFAAGIGSRLKPWTDSHPKALVEVGGKPMLAHVIERIVAAGIHDIIINVHHFADQIRDYIAKANFDADIFFSDETDMLLETGGGLRKVIDQIGNNPVLLYNADILTDFNLKNMISVHRKSKRDITLLTGRRSTQRYLVFNHAGNMRGWKNVSTGEVRPKDLTVKDDYMLLAFDGIHIVEPSVYDLLRNFRPENTPFSIMDFYIENCNFLKIKSYKLPEDVMWFDIGKPETLKKARTYYK